MTVDNFKSEVKTIADQIGVEFTGIAVRDMTSKWASCSSNGRLTFDVDLLKKDRKFRREVVLHELLHLRYPNHGKLFKRMLTRYQEVVL